MRGTALEHDINAAVSVPKEVWGEKEAHFLFCFLLFGTSLPKIIVSLELIPNKSLPVLSRYAL